MKCTHTVSVSLEQHLKNSLRFKEQVGVFNTGAARNQATAANTDQTALGAFQPEILLVNCASNSQKLDMQL